jgi:hypothetical protein
MGMIYRRKVAEGNADRSEDKRHGETECCPTCAVRFGRVFGSSRVFSSVG